MYRQIGGDDLNHAHAELTDVQVNCLCLVAEGYTSKEIAKRLGLTPMTVDQYLQRAKTALGAPDRRTAARWYVESRSERGFKSFELKPAPVADPLTDVTPPSASAAELPETLSTSQWQMRFGFPPVGGIGQSLDASQKTAAILRIAGLALICTMAFALVLGGALKAFS
ncbi:sigma-70-like protein [Blastomonas natatoria]|uniref:Sigma-70-like protein n=1 Tax=Blastomonas natatoria TaxID=34015 RepID=A0A2V3UUM9_9SPHN|nr:sigma-70-like protein [Blastomonas natatoria]